MEQKAYFPTMTGISDQAVLMVVPEIEEDMRPILESDEEVKFSSRWFLHQDQKQLILQIDWGTGAQSNVALSEDQQKKLVPSLLDKGHLGLMFDYDPDAEEKSSGVLLISDVDKGLKEIGEQLAE